MFNIEPSESRWTGQLLESGITGQLTFTQLRRRIQVWQSVAGGSALTRHLIGIGELVAAALVLRFWLHTHIGLDIEIHDAYRVVLLNVIGFWFLMRIASVWFLIVTWESIRRHP
jgi:hypothetical protein